MQYKKPKLRSENVRAIARQIITIGPRENLNAFLKQLHEYEECGLYLLFVGET